MLGNSSGVEICSLSNDNMLAPTSFCTVGSPGAFVCHFFTWLPLTFLIALTHLFSRVSVDLVAWFMLNSSNSVLLWVFSPFLALLGICTSSLWPTIIHLTNLVSPILPWSCCHTVAFRAFGSLIWSLRPFQLARSRPFPQHVRTQHNTRYLAAVLYSVQMLFNILYLMIVHDSSYMIVIYI